MVLITGAREEKLPFRRIFLVTSSYCPGKRDEDDCVFWDCRLGWNKTKLEAEDTTMKMNEVRDKAKALGLHVKSVGVSKGELIHKIQS
ncbi:MAG: hypothetical protein HQK58_06075, partial [Deltaproteobacteria bacterium]|nr:hypothetical protein [Deltaproteobacteria bacterium]